MSMNIRSTVACIAAASLVLGCATRHTVYKVGKNVDSLKDAPGVYYSLPYTKFVVAIPVTRVKLTPGKFKDLASIFFPGEEVVKEPSIQFKMATPQLKPVTCGDKDNVFLVKLTANAFQRRAVELKLNDLGLLTDASSVVEDKRLEVGLTLIKTAATAMAKYYGMQAPLPISKMSAAGFDTLEKARTVDSDDPLYLEAKNSLQQLQEIEARRIQLAAGRVDLETISKDVLDAMLKKLDDMESNIIGEFLGKKTELTWLAQCLTDPGVTAPTEQPLFKFSNLLGIRAEKGVEFLEGPPLDFIYGDEAVIKLKADLDKAIQNEKDPKKLEALKKLLDSTGMPVQDLVKADFQSVTGPVDTLPETAVEPGDKSGFFYRVPAEGKITVWRADRATIQDTRLIAQFGQTVSLPISLGSLLASNYKGTWSDTVGNIKSITSETQPISAAWIQGNVDPAVNAVMDAMKAKEELEARKEAIQKAEHDALVAQIKESIQLGTDVGAIPGDAEQIQKAIDFMAAIFRK